MIRKANMKNKESFSKELRDWEMKKKKKRKIFINNILFLYLYITK
jgi:hypothetical protein